MAKPHRAPVISNIKVSSFREATKLPPASGYSLIIEDRVMYGVGYI
jgi:hypothetical protein